jgi:hypothetical protein
VWHLPSISEGSQAVLLWHLAFEEDRNREGKVETFMPNRNARQGKDVPR